MIASIDRREAAEQSDEDYGLRKGLSLRDEVSTAFRVAQAHFDAFSKLENPSLDATSRYIKGLLEEAFGFDDLASATLPIALTAGEGRVPVSVCPPQDELDKRSEALSGDRSRSAAFALQDWLNEREDALWGLATNGHLLRLMRDNASLTRPAYIEANLAQIFETEDIASFAAIWLIIHRSRFGAAGTPDTDCALERWREAGTKEGETARDRLAGQVEEALKVLGTGFLRSNSDLAKAIAEGEVDLTDWFNELLRLVYRLIFLMVAEDRELLHDPRAPQAARRLYTQGYSLAHLRELCIRRSAWDRHHDKWEGLKIVFMALANGEEKLGLPALGGLFDVQGLPSLGTTRLNNTALMEAVYKLAWFSDGKSLVRVNWRAMETEELGSVYESLLELQPQLNDGGNELRFASEASEAKGNQRKTTGSYYTPDSLVQALLDSALNPVLDRTEAEADDPVEGLLNLSVIDPACGSGHFLLAAARRIATRVARLRGGGTAGATEFRHALRDVARRCIYGVDRNPMAVELTKVALWIETIDPGMPLGFLDTQIRCGDALLGVYELDVLRQGIPDAAYKSLTGDDTAVAKYYATKNRKERVERDQIAEGFGFNRQQDLMKAYSRVKAMSETTLREIRAKAEKFKALTEEGAGQWALARACDLYVSAFLKPKTTDECFVDRHGLPQRGKETVPTSGSLWEHLRGVQVFEPMMAAAIDYAANARAFHWPLEFPDIMATGGFDVVLGNPPWERVKLQEQEFFALRDQLIATAKNKAARTRLIDALNDTNPRLAREWQEALRQAAVESHFLRNSGRFPLGGVGDVNTYAVFTDLAWQLIAARGRAGIIIPNGLVVGFTYREFLRELLSQKRLISFFGFENEDKLFKDVHNETKFGLLTFGGRDFLVEQPWFTAHIRQPSEIADPAKRYILTIDEIRAINPNTLNLPTFRWSKDAEVSATIHSGAPPLLARRDDKIFSNPWAVKLTTLFHMSGASENFIDHGSLDHDHCEFDGACAVFGDGRRLYPLYEGKMVWHFDHRYGTYENQTIKQSNKGVLPRVSELQHKDPLYRIQPRYWVDAKNTDMLLGDDHSFSWFFVWRDVGPSERTLVGTILPKTAANDKSPLLLSKQSSKNYATLVAIMSSLVADYSTRQKASNVKFYVLEQVPTLTPDQLSGELVWINGSIIDWISSRVLELCYTSIELTSFARDLGHRGGPFKWLSDRRRIIQAEIDAALLHLYELNREQVDWLLNSFKVLRKYEERDHGEFLTKRLVMTTYDAIAEARKSGTIYETPLAPPPADPSLCHNASAIEELGN
ncbi:N-6 DNA methylase [Hyphobacterium sp. CCMP332]|uniref:Eco57I restriction-modification methylase domain-containing protein n=1 Tax=Hyphobacterium sp. CCMP332 TaxID=2749086 RepID=UPI001F298CE9|nr:N-6 DNA methylase [Hyphobacterium sp. CCMP332]